MKAVSRVIATEYFISTLRKMERDKLHSLRTWVLILFFGGGVLILILPFACVYISYDVSEPPLPYLQDEKHYTYFLVWGEGG